MIRKLCVGALAIAGIALVLGGLSSWHQSRQVLKVADQFLRAQQTGDTTKAHAALHADLQAARAERSPANWHAFPQLRYQLGRPEIAGNRATLRAWVEYAGTKIAPRIQLERDEEAGWRITNIENLPPLRPDPNEQLAEELEQQLRSHRLATLPAEQATSRQ